MLTYQTKLANMVTIICSPCYYRCIIIDCILYTVKTVSLLVSECHFESVQHFANFLWVSSYERSVLCLYVPYLLLKRLDNVNFTHQNWRTNFYFGKLKKTSTVVIMVEISFSDGTHANANSLEVEHFNMEVHRYTFKHRF